MAEPFLAEIRIFPFNFAPRNWAFCNGQIMPIQQNAALFSLLGTNYGGNGISNFGLPNLQGSVPLHAGQGSGPGLTPRVVGEVGGAASVSLLTSEMPAHNHALRAAPTPAAPNPPTSSAALARSNGTGVYTESAALTPMSPVAIGITGGNQPHNNLQPYLTLNFCIALAGVFPSRS